MPSSATESGRLAHVPGLPVRQIPPVKPRAGGSRRRSRGLAVTRCGYARGIADYPA